MRGPKTRDALLQNGIDCPEHYGDPALLLPLFYSPARKVSGKISIIPNCITLTKYGSPLINILTKEYGCNLIHMGIYDKWTDIIDIITGSSFVMSESLHGLIVAETYNIPCAWVELVNHDKLKHNDDWQFKYLDFYESIGKYNMQCLRLYEHFNFGELMKLKDSWKPGNIDYEKQLEYFPFEIKPEFKPQIAEFLRTNKNSPES